MALVDIRLGTVLESVEAEVANGLARFRVVVPESVLREHFGAGESSQSWLEAFGAHVAAIERAALLHHQASGRSTVVLLRMTEPTGQR